MTIKSFEFADFFQKDWPTWKFVALNDAFDRYQQRLLSEMAVAAGNVTKMPILWDKDDYKFLSQFPEKKWGEALSWRYNAGLLEASQIREEAKEGGMSWEEALQQVPEERDELVFREKGKTYVFRNVWTGLRSLIAKLEQPYRYHSGHNPAGLEPDKPGVHDVDPFETDEASPRHPKNYSGGFRNYDLSSPAFVDDSFIDEMIPDEAIELHGKPPTEANYRAAREKMKKRKQNSFAGMSVLQGGETVARMIGDWKRAAGYGLLGTPTEYVDELSGEGAKPLSVTYDTVEQKRRGRRAAGAKDAPMENLRLPYITRQLNVQVLNAEGKDITTDKDRTAKIPVLPAAKLLPRIPDFSAEQRQELAARRGAYPQNCKGYREGMPYEEVEKICPELRTKGRFGQLSALLSNFDILTPAQRKHMRENQRDYIHLLSHRMGRNICPKCKGEGEVEGHTCDHCFGSGKDPWSQPSTRKAVTCPTCKGEKQVDGQPCPECKGRGVTNISSKGGHYVLGWSPNKRSRGIEMADMDKEALSAAITKWLPELKLEAAEGVRMWINWAKGKGAINPEVVNMVESAFDPLVDVAALFAGLNINHPVRGIYDPTHGLTNVIPKTQYTLRTKDVNAIAKALGEYEMPSKFWQRNSQTETVKKTMDYATATRIAKELVTHEDGQYPEKIASFSLDWIMKALAEAGLTGAGVADESPADEELPDEEGGGEDEEGGEDEASDDKMALSVSDRAQLRVNEACYLAADFSQRAFGSVGSKRFRQKHGFGSKLTGAADAGEEGGQGIDDLAAGDDKRGSEVNWYTRRQQLRPDSQIGVVSWNVPKIGHEIDNFFDTYRDKILKRTTPQLAQQVDVAKEKAKLIVMTKIELMKQAAEEVIARDASIEQDEFDRQAEELAMSRLGDALKQRYPQMFKGDEDIAGATGQQADQTLIPDDMKEMWDDEWADAMQGLIGRGTAYIPRFQPGTENEAPEILTGRDGTKLTLDMLARVDDKGVLDYLRNTWSMDGAKKYGIQLMMAVAKKAGRRLSREQAVAIAAEAGITPSASGLLTGKKGVPPALHGQFDAYMGDFLKQIIRGEDAAKPVYNAEEEGILNDDNDTVSLADFPATQGKPDAHMIVQWLEKEWDEEGAKKWAVPLYIAAAKRAGSNVSERQAVHEIIEGGGIIPTQATPEDQMQQPTTRPDAVPLRPQPGVVSAQPAAAASNVSALLGDLVTNYDQIMASARAGQLAAHKDELNRQLTALRQRIQAKRGTEPVTPQERDALIGLGMLVRRL